jgi:hypothetical protein
MSKTKYNIKKKPKTEREWALCRAHLSCSVASDVLQTQSVVDGRPPMEYALYCLCTAISEISKALWEKE